MIPFKAHVFIGNIAFNNTIIYGTTKINFLPKKTPLFKIDETIECFEKNLPFFLSKCGALYKFDIDEIYVLFEIDKLCECLTKKDVKNLFQNNPIKNIVIEQSIYKGLY